MLRRPSRALAVAAALLALGLGIAARAGLATAEEGADAGAGTGAAPASLAAVTLEDQHGVSHRIDASTRAVLFTSDMDAGDAVKTALAEGGAERLARAGAVYVADVSRMPSIIRRTMAEPAMRKRPYPMLLDREGEATKGWPRTSGQATLLVLDGLRVARTQMLSTPDAVVSALDAVAAAPEAGDPPR